MTYLERMEELEDRRRRAWGQIRRESVEGAQSLGDRLNLPPLIRKHPFASMGVAAAAGTLLALVWRNGNSGGTQKVKVEVAVKDDRPRGEAEGAGRAVSPVEHLTALLQRTPTADEILQAVALHYGANLAEKYLPYIAEAVARATANGMSAPSGTEAEPATSAPQGSAGDATTPA